MMFSILAIFFFIRFIIKLIIDAILLVLDLVLTGSFFRCQNFIWFFDIYLLYLFNFLLILNNLLLSNGLFTYFHCELHHNIKAKLIISLLKPPGKIIRLCYFLKLLVYLKVLFSYPIKILVILGYFIVNISMIKILFLVLSSIYIWLTNFFKRLWKINAILILK